jgi:hypothetical protein
MVDVDGDDLTVVISFPPMNAHRPDLDDEVAVAPGVWARYEASGEIAELRVTGAVSVDINPELPDDDTTQGAQ